MRMEEIKEIANAVLYEGYLLYPYRRSAIKNRQRWTIGVVYPREYSEANGSIEPWMMQSECLVAGSADTPLDIYVRFLHLIATSTEQAIATSIHSETRLNTMQSSSEWSLANRLANEPWEEVMEREVSIVTLPLSSLCDHPQIVEIAFPGERIVEEPTNQAKATLIREQQPLTGSIIIDAKPISTDLFKISVRIENRTGGTGALTSQKIMAHSFVSTHTILHVHEGTFISLMDPPESLKSFAQDCNNLHTWPVLVGNEGECSTMLSSPIILYDYPQIAPESPGSLFDGTEIDEILTLRILTLTDEEKEEMRQGDERAREILERTESLSPEQFMKLHGVIRSLRPVDERNEDD